MKEKVELVVEPRVVIAVMHTTTIRASMTAYSTAVGPSSLFRKLTRACPNLRMCLAFRDEGDRRTGRGRPGPGRATPGRGLGARGRVEGHVAEGVAGVGADRADGDADDDDGGQHDR